MVVSGVTITDERDKIVDFSDPYIIVQQGVLMRVERMRVQPSMLLKVVI